MKEAFETPLKYMMGWGCPFHNKTTNMTCQYGHRTLPPSGKCILPAFGEVW